MKKFLLTALLAMFITALVNVVPAAADVTILPDPMTVIYADGDPTKPIGLVASQHDDFYSYSAELLDKLGYPGFNWSTGTGKLDLLIYTGAEGASNVSVAGGPFPDPLSVPSGSNQKFFPEADDIGTWGLSDSTPVVKVSSILDFLHSYDPSINIPVFRFDMNQTGNEPDVWMSGQVRIVDSTDGSLAASWAFDNDFDPANPAYSNNSVYNPDAMVLAMGKIELGVDECTNPNNNKPMTCYALDNNVGSGGLDFIAYAPTMDLSAWADPKYMFLADFQIGNPTGGFGSLNNGFEELFMTGAFAPENSNPVPEPASVLLFTTGLLGLAGLKRKK